MTVPDRVYQPVVEQQASWIVVNPAQGCPKNCAYCFLKQWGQTQVAPRILSSAAETVQLLLSSGLVRKDIPLCFLTHTDPMAGESNRRLLLELMRLTRESGIDSPLCFVTKCPIPAWVIDELADLQGSGARIIAYLSLSGLPQKYEPLIDPEKQRRNFSRLAEAEIPIVHYWRPITPANGDVETLSRVHRWVSPFARCSVATGLKLYATMRPQLGIWPELGERFSEAVAAEDNWPVTAHNHLNALVAANPHYPVFTANSCALSHVLEAPDLGGYLGTPACISSNCAAGQRERCRQGAADIEKRLDSSGKLLSMYGLSPEDCRLDLASGRPVMTISTASLRTSEIASIRLQLRCEVRCEKAQTDPYWSSGSVGANPLLS